MASQFRFYRMISRETHDTERQITVSKTTEIKNQTEAFEYCYNENEKSTEYGMSAEVSVGGVLKAFDIGFSMSGEFSEATREVKQEGKEMRQVVENNLTDFQEVVTTLPANEYYVSYIPIEVYCYRVKGKTYYAQVPSGTVFHRSLDEAELMELANGRALLDEISWQDVYNHLPDVKLHNIHQEMKKLVPKDVVPEVISPAPSVENGVYKIKTTYHTMGKTPAGRYLQYSKITDSTRNGSSNWVSNQGSIQSGNISEWDLKPGKTPGTYRIVTKSPKYAGVIDKLPSFTDGQISLGNIYPGGRGLSAWGGISRRDEWTIKVAVHDGDYWPMDWKIIPGSKPNTWRLLTTTHIEGETEPGYGLAAYGNAVPDAKIDHKSSWVYVDSRPEWQMDWEFEKQAS